MTALKHEAPEVMNQRQRWLVPITRERAPVGTAVQNMPSWTPHGQLSRRQKRTQASPQKNTSCPSSRLNPKPTAELRHVNLPTSTCPGGKTTLERAQMGTTGDAPGMLRGGYRSGNEIQSSRPAKQHTTLPSRLRGGQLIDESPMQPSCTAAPSRANEKTRLKTGRR